MPRNAEVIRQWKLLLHLDGKAHGQSVDDLASELHVTKRTVWRDLAALQEAGFPLVDEKRDRKTVWRVMHLPLKALTDAGLSVTEVCSLYVSRQLLLTLTGTPFEAGLNSLQKKVQKALSWLEFGPVFSAGPSSALPSLPLLESARRRKTRSAAAS